LYSNTIRTKEYSDKLLKFIKLEYGIDAINIYPAKRGFYGETWRIDTIECSYFVKAVYSSAHKKVYQKSFPIIEYINHHGIDFISKIVKTKTEKLYIKYDDAVIGVFKWIDGENRQDEQSKVQEYQLLAKIYTLSTNGLEIVRESFLSESADTFLKKWATLASDAPINTLLKQHRDKIEHRANRLRFFSKRCCNSSVAPMFITHGDAGGNFITNGNKCYIVDWDTPILTSPERDAWFCMHWDWAMKAFHEALRENGINYYLRTERLAYYCYHMFFFYLNAYIDRFMLNGDTPGIEEYMDGWIEDSFKFADNIT
jgi:hypothetical protein